MQDIQGRSHVKDNNIVVGRLDCVSQHAAENFGGKVGDNHGSLGLFRAQGKGHMPLGIAIDQQGAVLGHGQAMRQGHCRCGFSDTAFLVGDGDDFQGFILYWVVGTKRAMAARSNLTTIALCARTQTFSPKIGCF
jgi:hypothetical protein